MQRIEKLNSATEGLSTTGVHPQTSSFEVNVDGEVLWCVRRADACASVTLDQLVEQQQLDEQLLRGTFPVKWKVLTSSHPSLFCLGGDLELFLDCIERRDEATLLDYGLRAAHCVWSNASGFGPRRLGSIALVQGEAQGGGFEVALSCHWLVATRTANFGFPESLFGIKPGMGAHTLLAARVGEELAERMISSANRYSAEFLHEIGVVDLLVEPGDAHEAVQRIAKEHVRLIAPGSVDTLRALPYQDLVIGVEHWVSAVMSVSERHRRSMRYLLDAQRRRAIR